MAWLQRSGLNNDTYTIFTGVDDFSLLDVVNRYNGRSALTAWDDPKCNRIDGSEGAFFSIEALAARKPVYLFNGGMCRRLPLEFKEEVVVSGQGPKALVDNITHFKLRAQNSTLQTAIHM